ncbi:phage regulatory CII family protein [Azotobacter beijerinckii]|nr:phage regulatory CII family protein [Azotobacter beijerinckii]
MRRSFADQFERLDREVMTLPDALYLVSRNESMCRGGVTGFAYAFNRNPTTMAHKFDAGHPGHNLNTIELMDFLRYVSPEGRAIVLDSFHAELGDSQWFSTLPYEEEAEVELLVAGASEVLHAAADAANTVASHITDGRIDAQELGETCKLAARIVRVGIGLWRRARHVHLKQQGEGAGVVRG